MSILSTTSSDHHWTRHELIRALTRSDQPSPPPDPERALAHFGWGCTRCWKSLADLAALEPFPAPGEGPPLRRALQRCLGYLSTEGESRGALIDDLRPIHRHTLILACTERDEVERTFAFRRLVLEECRDLVLNDPGHLVVLFEATLEELQDPELEQQDGCGASMKALQALGIAYLADDFRARGDVRRARDRLEEAMQLLDSSPCKAEIYATCHELESDLARGMGDRAGVYSALHLADKMLERSPIPGRRAVTRLRLGLARAHFDDPEGAVYEFREALRKIPSRIFPRLRLQVIHHMAAAEVRCRRFEDARRSLGVAERLYARFATPPMRAERVWLWGQVELDAGNTCSAEKLLWTSLTLFESAGRVVDATQALMDLGRVYASTGNHEKLAQATMRFVRLSGHPEVRRLSRDARREILKRALRAGFRLDWEHHRALDGLVGEVPWVPFSEDDSEEVVN